MFMLRSGLILLFLCSIGVTLRSMEMSYMMGALAKWVCSAGLSVAIFCFCATYCRLELIHTKAPIRK